LFSSDNAKLQGKEKMPNISL